MPMSLPTRIQMESRSVMGKMNKFGKTFRLIQKMPPMSKDSNQIWSVMGKTKQISKLVVAVKEWT